MQTDVKEEIGYLLDFIDGSDCIFIRNNTSHSGPEARDHIEKKYRYIRKRKTIDSTQMFIASAASRSSLSGKPYMVRCHDVIMTSEQWLLEELERYRQLKTELEISKEK